MVSERVEVENSLRYRPIFVVCDDFSNPSWENEHGLEILLQEGKVNYYFHPERGLVYITDPPTGAESESDNDFAYDA